MINHRLFEHYGIDTTKDLGMTVMCPRPFDTLLIDKQGSCYVCECQSWLPQSIGNLQVKKLDEIIGNSIHQHIKSSIEDGSFRYCNNHRCSHLKHGIGWDSERPFQIRLAIDDSCNLRCPSCRPNMIFHKAGTAFKRGVRLADRVNDWLSTRREPVQVHIGSDGDPFASQVYRHFMEQTPKNDKIKYSILTNGLMFKEFHSRVPAVIGNLKEIGVSIDGATKETYELLRLGGKWEKILENLQCIVEQKEKNGFDFVMHYVVQRNNFHEMSDIVALAKKFKVDRLWLNKIEDWNVMDNWSHQDIFSDVHPMHRDFQREFEKIKPLLDRDDTELKIWAPNLFKR